jgi:GTP-binding protein
MYQFLKYYDIPVTIIVNKADKVGASKKDKNLKLISKTIDLAPGDDMIEFSSVTKKGREEVLAKIESLIVETI